MSLFTRNGKNTGNADPARAFGSEEQLMAEFSRQDFVRPQQKSGVMSGIRERLSSLTARSHETDAPVYSADTYSDENAPDLGWEAAFDPGSAQPSSPPSGPSGPSAEERFEQFRSTVYSSPARGGTGYSFGSYTRPAPVYEEISFSGTPRRESAPERPLYEEISLGGRERREPPSIAAPVYEDLTPGQRRIADPEPAPEQARGVSPSEETPPGPYRAPAAVGRAPRASDLQYMFWSGTIIAGVVLTVFSFIYACAM